MNERRLVNFNRLPILVNRIHPEVLHRHSDYVLVNTLLQHEITDHPHRDKKVLVITGAPGSGKDTSIAYLGPEYSKVRTTTTRPWRKEQGEPPDAYNFVTRKEFLRISEDGGFVETNLHMTDYAEAHLYGSPVGAVGETHARGLIPVFRVDPNGAISIHNMWRERREPFNNVLLIHAHIVPPDETDLYRRLVERALAGIAKDDVVGRINATAAVSKRMPQAVQDLAHVAEAHAILVNPRGKQQEMVQELEDFVASL